MCGKLIIYNIVMFCPKKATNSKGEKHYYFSIKNHDTHFNMFTESFVLTYT